MYGNKFSKSKTINRIFASCKFYCYLNALHFMKNIFFKLPKHYKLMSVVCMHLIRLAGLETQAPFALRSSATHLTATPVTTAPALSICSATRRLDRTSWAVICDSGLFIGCCNPVTTALHSHSHASLAL